MMKVLIGIPNYSLLLKEDSLSKLKENFELIINPSERIAARSFIEENIKDVDAYIAGNEMIDKEILKKAKSLKIIARYGVGIENIDIDFATRNKIIVTTTSGANSNSVAEHAVMLMLSVIRNVSYYKNAIKSGIWNIPEFIELKDKAVGLIGFGRIGRQVAKCLSGFTNNIFVFDPFVSKTEIENLGFQKCELDELLSNTNIVSLHLPSNNNGIIIGRRELSLMRNDSILINTARGALVDEKALYDALLHGAISGAGLDVVSDEPCKKDNILLSLDNVIVTPHIAGGSKENHMKAGKICVSAIEDVLLNRRIPESAINA